jgi:cold shock CspA family protein
MRIEGTLAKWNDDRGFGFIAPAQGGPEVFVHVSTFPRDGRRPRLGERLTFEIEIDKNGKKRAKNLLCPTRPALRRIRLGEPRGDHKKPSLLGRLIAIGIVVVLVTYGYDVYKRVATPRETTATPQEAVSDQSNDRGTSSSFRCDGRTHCSQMTSCADATFFLRNCPNVQMDGGNQDGIPCEQQWCSK